VQEELQGAFPFMKVHPLDYPLEQWKYLLSKAI